MTLRRRLTLVLVAEAATLAAASFAIFGFLVGLSFTSAAAARSTCSTTC